MEEKTKKKNGRPTKYTPALAKRICQAISSSTCGLERLAKMHDWMPAKATVLLWRVKHEKFSDQYAQAKKEQAHFLAEDCIDIADASELDTTINDNGNEVCDTEYVQRCKLRIDTRKWFVGKVLPKIYADTRRVEEVEEQNADLRAELVKLKADLDAENQKEY